MGIEDVPRLYLEFCIKVGCFSFLCMSTAVAPTYTGAAVPSIEATPRNDADSFCEILKTCKRPAAPIDFDVEEFPSRLLVSTW